MECHPVRRYRSMSISGKPSDNGGPVTVDGLEVVEEQVVVLSAPAEPAQPRPGREWSPEDHHGLG